ncbi:MAG: 4'-phosphopantetheinyl transferase family protein [Thalassotalea sp.]
MYNTQTNTAHWSSIDSLADLSLVSGNISVLQLRASFLPSSIIEHAEEWLSTQEYQILAKRKGQQRINFLASRYCLKQLISRYLICEVINITIAFDEHSQQIKAYNKGEKLPFNLSISHKNDQLLIAISLTPVTIAVDLECLVKQRDFLKIAQQAFSTYEYNALVQSSEIRFSFYQLWTLKECWVKVTDQSLAKVLSVNIKEEYRHKMYKFCTFVKNNYIGSLLYPQDFDFKKIHFINVENLLSTS